MKYMIMMFGDQSGMEGMSPDSIHEMIEFMGKLNDELASAGELAAAEGLVDASQAKTVGIKDGVPVATDGPFAESKESLAGYWIVDVDGEERAIEIASRVVTYIDGWAGRSLPIEVRQVGEAPEL